jgi:polygalacturonase
MTVRDVRSYGATGAGESPDTDAFQHALDDCAREGGVVAVPPGEYRSGPLVVGSDTTLRLRPGARLRFVADFGSHPGTESRWEGWHRTGFRPCLLVDDAETVTVEGRGTIDGGGADWWQYVGESTAEYPDALRERLSAFADAAGETDDVSSFTLRPPLLQVRESTNVTVSGVTLRNSPFWNVHVLYSTDVTLADLTVANPADAPNGDGIDVDSSRRVRISDCDVGVGDDAICLKAGKDAEGRAVGRPTEAVTVTNCTIESGHGGVVVGSETAGGVRDVTVSNCTFVDTDRGVRIKTCRGRGGVVEDLRFESLLMRRVACPFVVNGFYQTDVETDPRPVDAGTPTVRNVAFRGITARNVESAGFLAGLPERRFSGFTFADVDIDATRPLDATPLSPAMAEGYEQRHGFYCRAVDDVSFSDVRVRAPDPPVVTAVDAGSLSVDGFRLAGDPPTPVFAVEDLDALLLSGCDADGVDGPYVAVRGESGRVSLRANHGDVASAVLGADPDD